jgi:hypothetical protein
MTRCRRYLARLAGGSELPVAGIEGERENAAEPRHAPGLGQLIVAVAVQGQEAYPGEQADDAEVTGRGDQPRDPGGDAEVQAQLVTLPRLNANVRTTIAAVISSLRRAVFDVSGLCPAGVSQHSWKVLAHWESF